MRNNLLIVTCDKEVGASVPLEDVGLLLLANPRNVITQQALSACEQASVAVVICDSHYMPRALMLSLGGSSVHAETLRLQIASSAARKARIWRNIVRAKIEAQAALLRRVCESSTHLDALAKRVTVGDTRNAEAQAAAYYWPRLLGPTFRRNPDGGGINALLNYGYAVLRACTARAIVGAGLHPALGIFHANRYNNYALADDLIEPLRPAVDELAWTHRDDPHLSLSVDMRRAALALVSYDVIMKGEHLPMWVALARYAASVREALTGAGSKVEIPQWHSLAVTERCGSL